MRYVIVGAGGVGGAIGGRLAEYGFDVVLVARGRHAQVLADDGLTLSTPDGVVQVRPPVVDGPAALEPRPGDVLILTTKTQDSESVLTTLAGLPVAGGGTAGERLPVVCAQNGVESERIALRRFARVYGICVLLPALHLEPGHVEAAGTPYTAMLDIGRYPDGTDDVATQVAADLAASRMRSVPRERIMPWKYAKLLRNVGNAAEALAGPVAAVGAVSRLARAEGEVVLRAAGIDWTGDDEWDAVRGHDVEIGSVGRRPRAGGSTWQSLARGAGTVEADYLNGEIALLGRLHGIPTPVNELLGREVTAAARAGRAPGSVPGADLLARVEAVAATTVG